MSKITIAPKFEVIPDDVLDDTSESVRSVKSVICDALELLVCVAQDNPDSQKEVAIARKLLGDVYADAEPEPATTWETVNKELAAVFRSRLANYEETL